MLLSFKFLIYSHQLSVCFRYMSLVAVDDKTDGCLLAVACSDGALRLVSVPESLITVMFQAAGETRMSSDCRSQMSIWLSEVAVTEGRRKCCNVS